MAFCTNCGERNSDDGKFCRNCGREIGARQPAQAAPPPPPAHTLQPQYASAPPPAAAPPGRGWNRKAVLAVAAAAVLAVTWMVFVHFHIWPFHHIGGRFKLEPLTAAQLEGKAPITPPTAEERERYQEYVAKVRRYAEARIGREEGKSASGMNAFFTMLAKGEAPASEQALKARLEDLSEGEAKVEGSFFGWAKSWIVPLFHTPVYAAGPAGGKISPVMLNNLANNMLLDGKFFSPVIFATLAAAEDPDSPEIACTIANLLKSAEDYENAMSLVAYGLKLQPRSEQLLYTGGVAALEYGDFDMAEYLFLRALNISGGPGPSNQGMMLTSMARKDYPSAFLYMLEGGRDAFNESIWLTYQKLRLTPDYFEMSGRIFDQYTLMQLMDFKRCRTAFDPTLDTVGQQIKVDGSFFFPDNIGDLNFSGDAMGMATIDYFKAVAKFYEEDAKQLGEAFEILSAGGLKEMKDRFDRSSLAPKQKTEAEQQVTYYQEMFWLSILNDYFAWEKKKIDKQFKKEYEGFDLDDFGISFDKITDEYDKKFEAAEKAGGMAVFAVGIPHMMAMIDDNAFTLPKDQKILASDLNRAFKILSDALGKQYKDTKVLVEEYWVYSNAILGLIADDAIYNEYRRKQRDNAMFALSGPVFFSGGAAGLMVGTRVGPMYTMVVGKDVALKGSNTGKIPKAPVLPISGKGASVTEMMEWQTYTPPPMLDTATKVVANLPEKPFITEEELEYNRQIWEKQHSQMTVQDQAAAWTAEQLRLLNIKRAKAGLPPTDKLDTKLCLYPDGWLDKLVNWDCIEEETPRDSSVVYKGVTIVADPTGKVKSIGVDTTVGAVPVNLSTDGTVFVGPNVSAPTPNSGMYSASAKAGVECTLDMQKRAVSGCSLKGSASASVLDASVGGEVYVNAAKGVGAELNATLDGKKRTKKFSKSIRDFLMTKVN
ncbi:MAG: zinc ribbon domain-containing protein [Acidobacteriota bacterium]|jgi:hypothetical protein|nr:zinc ribbon domain-containing protein [Acidobacteriota bacterium]